jgi:toxin ParE1/3/4
MANRPRKSPQAELDLTTIWDFIANDSIKAADALLERIDEAFDMLAQMPRAGRARNDLALNLRSFPVGSYVVYYVPVSDGIEVIRVMSGWRDVDADDMQ